MIDFRYISYVGTIVGVAVGVTWYIIQFRNMVRTRQAALFMQLYSTFCNKEFQKDYAEMLFKHEWRDFDEWMEKYGPQSNLDSFASYVSVPAYFEGIGVLVKRKLLDIELVNDMLSSQIMLFWEKIEDLTSEYRRLMNRPQLWEWYEYLYNEIKKMQKQVNQA